MRKHLTLFFSALIFIASCKDNKGDTGVIDKNKMALILTDIHLVDGTMMMHGANDSIYKYGTNRYKQVFKKYGIDTALFNKSIKYYAGEPEQMVLIYDQIGKLLAAKIDSTGKVQSKQISAEARRNQAKTKAAQKKDSLERDSVKNAKSLKLKINQKVL
ncbi:DUF4296 domain-containing protein [Mucilaginibacter auburnensis]|uniref:Uncharacterized protein DUF4296 n=1 Tax=Mucilaginibacter auburnensis TaxID=1457233 RepID=A0A2H9VVE4_9SPHI|nr:DUF4296 domain-containing protein [Mucilaginibacter auburnensis]PJJ84752.1 uncharacterized protein DUF4296 [Mucilaginibacter auburnensis]